MSLFKSAVILFFTVGLVGCSIDIDFTDLTRNSGNIDLTDESAFDFDPQYVEVKDGEIRLKPLDLIDSGNDFIDGRQLGSHLSTLGNYTLHNSQKSDAANIQNIASAYNSFLLGYWRFDGNGGDELGLLDATTSAAPNYVAGKLGQAASFDRTTYLLLDDTSNDLENYTVALWVYPGTRTGLANLFHRGAGGACAYSPVIIYNGTLSEIIVRESGCAASGEFASVPIDNSKWNHIVVTQANSQSQKFYLNGRLVATGSVDSSVSFSNYKTIVGGQITGLSTEAPQYEGMVDEVSIWSSALDSETISRIYNAQSQIFSDQTHLSSLWTPKWNNIVGYWKMDGNWQDSSGNGNHGTRGGNGDSSPEFSIENKVGSKSGEFDGVDDEVVMTTSQDSFEGSSEITLSLWLKTTTCGRYAGKEGTLRLSAHQFVVSTANNPWYSAGTVADTGDFEHCDGSWHHMVGTYDGSFTRVYIDGVLRGVGDSAISGNLSVNAQDFKVAYDTPSSPGVFISGGIDDVAIWDLALSTAEIFEIYNRQKQKYAGFYDSEVIDLGSATSAWQDLSWSTSLPFGKELTGDFDNDGNSDGESSSDYAGLDANLSANLEAYYAFNSESYNGTSEEIKDLSGNDHHGSMRPIGHKLTQTGKFNRTLPKNTLLFLTSSEAPTIGNSFTMSMWLKGDDENSPAFYSIVSKGDGSNNLEFVKIQTISGSKRFSMRLDVNGSGFVSVNSIQDVLDGTYRHVVFTYDEHSMKMYIDGELESTSINPLPSGYKVDDPTDSMNIGEDAASIILDEFTHWNRTLEHNEIQQLYRRGANRIKLQVKSCVDSSCNCKSFGASPASSVNDCDGDGIVNAEDGDDIHQAAFMGPGGDGTTFFSELMNRRPEDVTFDCDANTSDSNDDICIGDEILLAGSPKPTSPLFSFDDYLGSVKPQPNRYFQYRVHMEADENTACDGEPCLPELTSVNLNPSGAPRYYGQIQTVTSKEPLPYTFIRSAEVKADSCVSFQISPDGETFYTWSLENNQWNPPAHSTDGSPANVVESHLGDFAVQFGPGHLFLKAFLSSDTETPCALQKVQIESSEARGSAD